MVALNIPHFTPDFPKKGETSRILFQLIKCHNIERNRQTRLQEFQRKLKVYPI